VLHSVMLDTEGCTVAAAAAPREACLTTAISDDVNVDDGVDNGCCSRTIIDDGSSLPSLLPYNKPSSGLT